MKVMRQPSASRARAFCSFVAIRPRRGRRSRPRASPPSSLLFSRPAIARGIATSRTRPLDRRPRQSTARSGDGQSALALSFRPGDRHDPSDFGFNGAPPSHPELLDWLAAAYIRGGWRLKPIHRLIVTSATYRQSSRLDEKAKPSTEKTVSSGECRLAVWRLNQYATRSCRRAASSIRGWVAPDTTSGRRTPTTWRFTSRERSSRATRSAAWSINSNRAARATQHSVRSIVRMVRGPEAERLDDCAPGVEPAQQPVHDPPGRLLRRANRERSRPRAGAPGRASVSPGVRAKSL